MYMYLILAVTLMKRVTGNSSKTL